MNMRLYVFVTLFFTGAAVMVVELLGARIIGPYFGVSLYVWSAQISVALVSLAIGYWLGGVMADRRVGHSEKASCERKFSGLYILILLAAVWMFSIPLMSSPVIQVFGRLGLRVGALASSFVLFAVPLVLLGMVSPYAIKLLTKELSKLGITAGKLYAISTVGGFAGTLLTGMVLIPVIGVRQILYFQALILVLLSACGFIFQRRIMPGLLVMVLIFVSVLARPPWTLSRSAHAHDSKAIHVAESLYGELRVVDKGDLRFLLIDGVIHSVIDKVTMESLSDYPYHLAILPFFNPLARDVLVLGLGGGSISRAYARFGITPDSVEIDPGVVDIAERFFGYNDRDQVYIGDGREYLRSTHKKYDIVIFDTYASDAIPYHLTTKEAFQETKKVLKKNGIIALNYIGFPEGENSVAWKSIYQSIHSEFPFVRVFASTDTGASEVGNIIFIAAEEPLVQQKEITIEACKSRVFSELLHDMLANELQVPTTEGIVLTDDCNPIETWSGPVAKAWRKSMTEIF